MIVKEEFYLYIRRKMIMLVLGRKPGEYVMIGKDIMVKVVRSDEGDLRLAIDAPKYINIIRGEIYEDSFKYIQEEKLVNI
jgi:carbon storage regulator